MIIGLTSLCLYSNMNFSKMQYGKLYKIHKSNLCIGEKCVNCHQKPIDIFWHL